MSDFIKGLDLCESFFHELALPIIDKYFPRLKISAGLLGYGSDVLGYDDNVSVDHMWGPRFYLFLSKEDIEIKNDLMKCFEENLPYEYKGFSVNFSNPDPNDSGVRHPEFINSGNVSPLIWIQTIDEFISGYLGVYPANALEWLSVSEHRLLGFTSGRLFVDMLNLAEIRSNLSFYPDDVKLYLIASQWAVIAEEQAFVKRCGDCDDEIGSRIICSRIAERLMRLCFLYKDRYAPYSKWFGTGFKALHMFEIENELKMAIGANTIHQRESYLLAAQMLVAKLHNEFSLTETFAIEPQKYYSRDIQVLFVDRLSEMIREKITDSVLKNLPLIGTLSQVGNLVEISDNPEYIKNVQNLYSKTHA
jgi:hypothetical protein